MALSGPYALVEMRRRHYITDTVPTPACWNRRIHQSEDLTVVTYFLLSVRL